MEDILKDMAEQIKELRKAIGDIQRGQIAIIENTDANTIVLSKRLFQIERDMELLGNRLADKLTSN